MRKRLLPALRSPGEADVLVLNSQDAKTPQRREATLQRRTGAKVLRRTIWLPEDLADKLSVYAARERTTQAAVVGLALRKLLDRE